MRYLIEQRYQDSGWEDSKLTFGTYEDALETMINRAHPSRGGNFMQRIIDTWKNQILTVCDTDGKLCLGATKPRGEEKMKFGDLAGKTIMRIKGSTKGIEIEFTDGCKVDIFPVGDDAILMMTGKVPTTEVVLIEANQFESLRGEQ